MEFRKGRLQNMLIFRAQDPNMPVRIENQYLAVKIMRKGAEMVSVINKANHLEYLWSADPAFWPRTSPVLFPVVGALKENTYLYRGRKYSLNRHGFARDLVFRLVEEGKYKAVFALTDSEDTFKVFPFHFELRLNYWLTDDLLNLTYEVRNTGDEEMYFSIGGHPAIKTPLTKTSAYEDHYLEFSVTEDIDRWPINPEGLIDKMPLPLIRNSKHLKLTRELFSQDALVFKRLKSQSVSLKSRTHEYGVEVDISAFPYLGIWAVPGADFVCIEPWCGIADSVLHDQELVKKEGIQALPAGGIWSGGWRARFY